MTVSKHTHEHNKTHLIYYHTLTIQFTKSVTGNATLNVKFEIGYPLPSTYPDELKENTFLVLYGAEGHVNHVPDVYDDHPITHSSHTTTESAGIKTASKTPKDHGQDKTRPLFMYCNLTKSEHGNNVFMKAVAHNNDKTLIECNPLQFHSLWSQLLDIVEVTLTEWNRSLVQFNQDSPVIVTLFFKKKLEESQRKYVGVDDSMERELPI